MKDFFVEMPVYDTDDLYKDAFRMVFEWEKWLPEDVYEFHTLICRELNSSVDLQMGTLLPFVASLCGPGTKSLFLTRPSVINMFWLMVAASGVGKSQARKTLISEPLKYVVENSDIPITDFEVCKFTRAGKC